MQAYHQHHHHHDTPTSPVKDSRKELEDKKRSFEEAATRVKQKFFSYQRENACADVEQVRPSIFYGKRNTLADLETHQLHSCQQELSTQLSAATT